MAEENILELSTGVKLRITKPSLLALREIENQVNSSRPKPPMVFIEDKDREEPNDQDPDYLHAVNEWQAEGTIRQYNAAVVTGTIIHEIPDHVMAFESNDWHGVLSAIGFELGKSKQEKYIQWVKYIAGPTTEDFAMILIRVLAVLGIREEVVAQAIDSFQSDKTGGTDNVVALNGNNSDRNKVRPPSRRNRTAV